MNDFFRTIKGLSVNQDNWTAIGIDKELAGEKAVFRDGEALYRSSGFPEEIFPPETLKQSGSRKFPGLIQTLRGRVFLENLGTMKKLILCGGGHVSSATLSIAKMMEFHITVIEDRPSFAQTAKVHGADTVICEDFTKALEGLVTDWDTYILVMTRGHRHDLSCLKAILKKEYAYLGMMGSRARVKKIKEQLLGAGYGKERLDALHAPVGLAISASTPTEIGVSIMAEVILEKNRRGRLGGYEKELSAWLFSEEEKRPAVLATIIGRKGSTPRDTGTKMIVFQDGSSIGTIGGGCMEAEVCGLARHMLANADGNNKAGRFRTCFVDMTGREAEEEGMVCGGILEIFLELLPCISCF